MKTNRIETQKEIEKFFSELKVKSPREIKKIKRLAMNQKISLKKFRKSFCKYCLNPFDEKEKIKIKNGIKSLECKNCRKISRWRIKCQ